MVHLEKEVLVCQHNNKIKIIESETESELSNCWRFGHSILNNKNNDSRFGFKVGGQWLY